MPSSINNEASTTYNFAGSADNLTATSNENTITLEDASGLTLTKTANPTTYSAGEIITFTVNITNSSSSYLNGVRIIDNIGGGYLAYVVGSAKLTVGSLTYAVTPVATNPLTFTLQQLSVGGSMTLTYNCQVIFNLPDSVTSITNSVRGIGYTSSGTVNGYASATIQKKNSVSFLISKTSSLSEVFPNQTFSYVITLTNNSSTEAEISNVTDDLPSNFVLSSVTLKIGSGTTQTLTSSDYTLSGSNEFVIPSGTGPTITVPANSTTVITLTGYFS